MQAFLSRMKEPSTWAGLSILATLAGVPIAHVDAVSGLAAALAAVAAVFLKEKGQP